MTIHEILALDVGGTPFAWIAPRDAVGYYAARKVACDRGDDTLTFRGGYNRAGERSVITARPIIAIAGSELMARYAREVVPLCDRNAMLLRRDRMVCAYCGGVFRRDDLTRDHILADQMEYLKSALPQHSRAA